MGNESREISSFTVRIHASCDQTRVSKHFSDSHSHAWSKKEMVLSRGSASRESENEDHKRYLERNRPSAVVHRRMKCPIVAVRRFRNNALLDGKLEHTFAAPPDGQTRLQTDADADAHAQWRTSSFSPSFILLPGRTRSSTREEQSHGSGSNFPSHLSLPLTAPRALLFFFFFVSAQDGSLSSQK